MRYIKLLLAIATLVLVFKIAAHFSGDPTSMAKERDLAKYEYCSEEVKTPNLENKTIICIPKQTKDFGEVDGKVLEYSYEIINSGDVPLLIQNVRGTGGNMPSHYPRDPIPVGGKGVIKTTLMIKGSKGKISKTWTITSNTTPPSSRLIMKARLKDEPVN